MEGVIGVNEYNQMLRSRAFQGRGELKDRLAQIGVKRSSSLFKIRVRFYRESGMITRIGYNFPREGVYLHKGVGKGWPMQKVMVTGAAMRFRDGESRAWLDGPIHDAAVDILNIAEELHAGKYINNLNELKGNLNKVKGNLLD